ncbi:MAG: hypothetical protein COU35_00005, partial [Candidatus Magasanikbacteria bacterium CG10_big_fil_rev_8_21_14_0_10_47_10]
IQRVGVKIDLANSAVCIFKAVRLFGFRRSPLKKNDTVFTIVNRHAKIISCNKKLPTLSAGSFYSLD